MKDIKNHSEDGMIRRATDPAWMKMHADGERPPQPHSRAIEPMSPSPFYDQLIGAEKFRLSFPLGDDIAGPFWTDSGDLVRTESGETAVEDIEAVILGNDHFRLAERCMGPFSSLRLYWGDEFLAERPEVNKLILTKLVVPRRFEHFRFLMSPGFKNTNSIAELVHDLGGGWETVASGMLTITVPVLKTQEFISLVRAADLYLGIGMEN